METEDRSSWEAFASAAAQALGVEREVLDVDQILDLTRDIAHAAPRPMAPVGAYLVGVAVGRGMAPKDAVAAVTGVLEG